MSTLKFTTWRNLDDSENYKCRAWVNFDGTTSPGTIRASGNVSSVTRNGTGDYTVNFTTAMPDANYSIQASASRDTTGQFMRTVGYRNTSSPVRTTTACSIEVVTTASTTKSDQEFVELSFFR